MFPYLCLSCPVTTQANTSDSGTHTGAVSFHSQEAILTENNSQVTEACAGNPLVGLPAARCETHRRANYALWTLERNRRARLCPPAQGVSSHPTKTPPSNSNPKFISFHVCLGKGLCQHTSTLVLDKVPAEVLRCRPQGTACTTSTAFSASVLGKPKRPFEVNVIYNNLELKRFTAFLLGYRARLPLTRNSWTGGMTTMVIVTQEVGSSKLWAKRPLSGNNTRQPSRVTNVLFIF